MSVDKLLMALVLLLAVSVCASAFIAHREIKRHNKYMKEIK
jgi:hypothetical protein